MHGPMTRSPARRVRKDHAWGGLELTTHRIDLLLDGQCRTVAKRFNAYYNHWQKDAPWEQAAALAGAEHDLLRSLGGDDRLAAAHAVRPGQHVVHLGRAVDGERARVEFRSGSDAASRQQLDDLHSRLCALRYLLNRAGRTRSGTQSHRSRRKGAALRRALSTATRPVGWSLCRASSGRSCGRITDAAGGAAC